MNKRLIARLDIKNDHVIKGIHLEGLRKVGKPQDLASEYYRQGADELLFMDAVASLYGRNNLFETLKRACERAFVPLTIGGGVRSLADFRECLLAGADKVAINTQAIKTPELIAEASRTFGAQCVVISIEAKRKGNGTWMAYTDCGREPTGVNLFDWIARVQELGAGEVLVTSIDQEGTERGFDWELLDALRGRLRVPLVVSGGAGTVDHVARALKCEWVDGVALASVLHYKTLTIGGIKELLRSSHGIEVRP